MNLRAIDLHAMSQYIIPVAVLLIVVLYLIIRKFVVAYINLDRQVKVQAHAIKMRQNSQTKAPDQTFVRKTDLYDQLTAEQKTWYKQAEELEAQKKFREAARIFEGINFQRKAIDLLEFNGFIDDAAQMLIRMKAVYRAAIVYERNHLYLKAAECFTMDQKHDAAGRSYEKAAAGDFHLFLKAAESYTAAGMIDPCLEAYAKVLKTPEILRISLSSQKFTFLANYMAAPYNAKAVLEAMTPEQASALIDGLHPRPDWVQSMSVWVMYRQDLKFFDYILLSLEGQEDLALLFWSRITPPYINYLLQSLAQSPELFSKKTYDFHGKLLMGTDRKPLGELFLQNAQRMPPPSFDVSL